MIQEIRVTNQAGESLRMELRSPEKSGLLVRSITGLGPPNANINMYETATIDGSRYVGSRAQTRNIVMTLCPIWTEANSVEQNRLKAYQYFPIKQKIKLEIITDIRTAYITGYIESNEADIFSNEESLTISILCPDPYFYESEDGEEIIFYSVDPLFEFPFFNEPLNENTLELSQYNTLKSKTVTYTGDVEIGIIISLRFIGSVTGTILIYNPAYHDVISIDTSKLPDSIQANDTLEISSIPGNKYVKLGRESTWTNVLNAVDRSNMAWLRFRPGLNTIVYSADSGEDNIRCSIIFNPAYQGV